MATKQDKPKRAASDQHGFRLTEEESLRMEALARLEGFPSIAAWARALTIRRAELLQRHLDEGTYVTIHDRKVPYDEVPGSDENECRIYNAQAIMSQQSDLAALETAALWLATVAASSRDAEKERVDAIAKRLPPAVRTKYNELKKTLPPF